ncbi:MAG: S9 family peptidase [Pseudomonadota bacterium]
MVDKRWMWVRVVTLAALALALVVQPVSSHGQEAWTPDLSLEVKRIGDLGFSPDGQKVLYSVSGVDLQTDTYPVAFKIVDLTSGDSRTVLDASPHISGAQWSPDGTAIAYLSSESGKTNIWMISVDGGERKQLTDVDDALSSFQWAPDGKAIAFVMTNMDGVDPAVQDSAQHPTDDLWLLELEDKAPKGMRNLTANYDFSVSTWSGAWAYDWSPDSKTIAFAAQERPGLDAWVDAKIAVATVETGTVEDLAIGNTHWAFFPRYSPDGQWLAFLNAPGPFKWSFLWNVKLAPTAGGDIIELAPTDNQSPLLWQWAPDSKSVYYVENDRATYSFFALPIDGGAPTKIFGAPGDLEVPGINTYLVSSMVHVNNEGTKVAYVGQTYGKAPEVYISDVETFAPEKITAVNAAHSDRRVAKTELVTWRSLDNTPVEGLLTYPSNHDPSKRYPLVLQIHGGPNGVDFNEYLPLMRYFATAAYASEGYFVFRVNYRGSLGYGRRFREGLVGEFGVLDYQDLMSGVNHVINEGLVDPDQLFVIGQSNGGTMTGWIITQTDRFKSACSIAGETDYISLEGTNGYFQTSWYMGGSFIDHLQIFLDRSPIFHVATAKTPILLQGGLLDDNVPFSQVEEFHRALKRVGVETELVGYPGAEHEYYPPRLYKRLLHSCLDWTNRFRGDHAAN